MRQVRVSEVAKRCGTGGWGDQPDENPHGGGLPCAIGTQETGHPPRFDHEAEVVYGEIAVVALDQPIDNDRRHLMVDGRSRRPDPTSSAYSSALDGLPRLWSEGCRRTVRSRDRRCRSVPSGDRRCRSDRSRDRRCRSDRSRDRRCGSDRLRRFDLGDWPSHWRCLRARDCWTIDRRSRPVQLRLLLRGCAWYGSRDRCRRLDRNGHGVWGSNLLRGDLRQLNRRLGMRRGRTASRLGTLQRGRRRRGQLRRLRWQNRLVGLPGFKINNGPPAGSPRLGRRWLLLVESPTHRFRGQRSPRPGWVGDP